MIAQIEHGIQRAAEGQQPSSAIRRDAAGDDQTNAALRALTKVCGELWVILEAVFHAVCMDPMTTRLRSRVKPRWSSQSKRW
jgi:hypothetical protein